MPPTIRGQYQLLEKLGVGGMGEVYQARDTKLNRMVAVKILKPDQRVNADQQRRFVQEAQAASALNHPNIIVIHDIISEEGSEIMIMEYVAGRTLSNMIAGGGLPVSQVVNLGLQIADALCAAHAAGIIHRDLKPGNIMVNDKDRIKILDFGLAKLESPQLSNDPDATQVEPMTMQGSIMGTLCYMSPEQAQGKKVDARSDIFSFGAVLYEMATGQRAFTGDSGITMLTSVLRDEPRMIHEITPNTPPELEHVVHRCLRKDLDERFQTMQEVYQTLEMIRQTTGGPRTPISISIPPAVAAPKVLEKAADKVVAKPATAAAAKSKMGPIAAGVAFLVAAGGGGAWYLNSKKTPVVPPEPIAAAVVEAPPEAPAPPPVNINLVTNDSVIGMVKGKVPNSLIISQIKSSETKFDLSPDGVIGLVQSGVPESIIEVMRDPTKAVAAPSVAPTGVKPAVAVATAPGGAKPAAAAGTTAPGSKSAGPVAATPATPVAAPLVRPGTKASGNDVKAAAAAQAPLPLKSPEAIEHSIVVSEATPIALVLTEDIPLDADEGRPIHFRAVSDTKVGDTVVVTKGSAAIGTVYSREKKKQFVLVGRGTKVNFQLANVIAANGTKLKLRATIQTKKDEDSYRGIDSKSKEVAAAKGTQFIGYVDGPQTLKLH